MKHFCIFIPAFLLLFACKEDDNGLDPQTKSLITLLDGELKPLSSDPILWTDEELQFLDAVKNNAIIGLGEATHGTAEFFKAKHRILKYLVENHNYRVFAIEADFGESLLINEAVQNSDKSQIESLMKSKMQFWTWRTKEVRDLLHWMCDYNAGKSTEEKVQYVGVDCQYNTYHPDMVKDYLEEVNASFYSFAEDVLVEAKAASADNFSSYTLETFDNYLGKIDALKDSLIKYEADMINASSLQRYQLNLQLINITRQASEVRYYIAHGGGSKNYRDQYMAENAIWSREYFNAAKMVLWAHNWHVSEHSQGSSMGYHLKNKFPADYYALCFLFSRGSFTAVTHVGTQYLGPTTQSLKSDPKSGSMNDLMSKAKPDVFAVKISDLTQHNNWFGAFITGIEYFQIGSVYNNKPEDYYSPFSEEYFDHLIYFDETTASVLLK